jgi:DNA mismatch repair protein MutS
MTPMLKQYFDVKKQYPGCVLFFRVGDFFETYGEDAETASRELEIVKTSRDNGREDPVSMAGVPFHAVEGYLRRLVQKGYKVALCDQVEDPRLAKGLVKREVVRVLTAGTVLDPQMLDSSKNNYLMSLASGKNGWGMALADVSTGEFLTSRLPIEGHAAVLEEVQNWKPSEIILDIETCLHERLLEGIRALNLPLTRLEEVMGQAEASGILKDYFGLAMLDGVGLSESPEAVKAAAAVIRYLKDTQKTSVLPLQVPRTFSSGDCLILDYTTSRNLELTETMVGGRREGSLLWVMDRTTTPMGARLLRRWMERPLVDMESITARQDAVEDAVSGYSACGRLRKIFSGMADLERVTSRIVLGTANARDLLALRNSLGLLPGIAEALSSMAGCARLKELLEGMDLLEDVRSAIEKTIAEDPPLGLRDGGLIRPGYDPGLDELKEVRSSGREWIARMEETERERTGIRSLKVGFNNVFGYYIEVTRSNLSLVPQDYIRKQTIAGGERFISPELKEYEARILGADEKIKALEYEIFLRVREETGRQAARIQKLAGILAELDVLSSFADLAVERNYSRPEMTRDGVLVIRNGRHPVVEVVLGGSFVPNDLRIDSDLERFLIITGPNMAGKSTYLRQTALMVIMAQMGSFIPAEAAQVGVVDRVFTRVGATDDLHLGKSTFMVEMAETANILNNATVNSLVILDEIGRGTSTFDGMSLAWAVAEHLSQRVRAKTLFATHFHEMTRMENDLPGIRNYRVEVRENGKSITFLHRIVPGGADRSYGIYVARLAGIPPPVLNRAHEILEELERKEREPAGRIPPRERPAPGVQLGFFEPQPHPLLEEIKKVSLERMTPLEAMVLIDRWKKGLNEEGGP